MLLRALWLATAQKATDKMFYRTIQPKDNHAQLMKLGFKTGSFFIESVIY